jgi:hypothetical protein
MSIADEVAKLSDDIALVRKYAEDDGLMAVAWNVIQTLMASVKSTTQHVAVLEARAKRAETECADLTILAGDYQDALLDAVKAGYHMRHDWVTLHDVYVRPRDRRSERDEL